MAVALLVWAAGPVVLLVAGATLYLPRVRAWLRPTRRVVVAWVGAVLAVAVLAVVVPDGWAPIAPGPGTWVTPAYVGRPVVGGTEEGPSGESPHVTTKGYGLDDCGRVAAAERNRLVAVCGGADDAVLRLVDPVSLRLAASKSLPARGGCPAAFAVDGEGRVIVAARARLWVVGTADAEGEPDLTTEATLDLDLDDDDCVTGVAVHGARTWFVSHDGVAGVVADGRVRVVDLDDTVERPVAVDAGGAYVAGRDALHRVVLAGRRPTEAWSSPYDDGGDRGAAPVPLRSGLVAVADNREPRLQVVFHRADTGAVVCRAEVFGDDRGATDGGLVAAGADGVVVQNSHGYAGPLSTVLGRTTDRGLARVDVVDGDCRVTWATELDAPSGAPAVSEADGLVYAYVKRHSWLGVDAWYLAALDLDTGRLLWARRTGLGVLRDNHHGAVTLGPDRSAYVPVLGGLVRVHDRT